MVIFEKWPLDFISLRKLHRIFIFYRNVLFNILYLLGWVLWLGLWKIESISWDQFVNFLIFEHRLLHKMCAYRLFFQEKLSHVIILIVVLKAFSFHNFLSTKLTHKWSLIFCEIFLKLPCRSNVFDVCCQQNTKSHMRYFSKGIIWRYIIPSFFNIMEHTFQEFVKKLRDITLVAHYHQIVIGSI